MKYVVIICLHGKKFSNILSLPDIFVFWKPNCFSRVVTIDSEEHIIIFAKRDIEEGEELSYDYRSVSYVLIYLSLYILCFVIDSGCNFYSIVRC